MSAGSPQFPPSVADRLQEPAGSAVVHVTPAARTRRPTDLRWLLMATLDRPVLATLVLDNAGRLRFSRTERAVGTVQARADVAARAARVVSLWVGSVSAKRV